MAARRSAPENVKEFLREIAARGGKVRARRMTKEERSASARKAVKARWAKAKQKTSS